MDKKKQTPKTSDSSVPTIIQIFSVKIRRKRQLFKSTTLKRLTFQIN